LRVILDTSILLSFGRQRSSWTGCQGFGGPDDPADDFLLALCEAGAADYLVTGDWGGLLILARHGSTQILTAGTFLERLGQ
jgi:predicted nucleic acid-binding protein